MTPFRWERLAADHDLEDFRSGADPLDRWLVRSARHADAANTGRTIVWTQPPSRSVVGSFTLSPHLARLSDVPAGIGHGFPDAIPAILIARLALDHTLQGHGLGAQLLRDALERAGEATNIAGGRLIVVDAIDDTAARFYEHFGFRRIPGSLRLVRKSSEVASDLSVGS